MRGLTKLKSIVRKRSFKKVVSCIIGLILLFGFLTTIGYYFIIKDGYGTNFDNSFYSSNFLKDKTVMVIAPHEDDEINIAGSTIKSYVDAGSKVIVVFVTNGDYVGLGNLRINEAINSVSQLGVKSENVVFLGYGDQWNTKYGHIYNSPSDEVIESHIGNKETYGNDSFKDYSTVLTGEASAYTRNNLKNNMKEAIINYKPDIILASDFDLHSDHRATSLIFEEVMGEILKSNNGYTPKVFKGFGYNTAWNEKNDFYNYNLQSTNKPSKEVILNDKYELDVPNYNWDDRIRFLVPKDTLTYTLLNNPIYKALGKHKTQNAKIRGANIINSDKVFFERKTNSITYYSEIEVSSGQASYLNDFKLIDSTDISLGEDVKFNDSVWIPDSSDNEKSVKIKFNESKDIESIALYDNFSLEDNILLGKLIFSDGSEIIVNNLNKNGSKTIIDFDKKNNIDFVEFKILQYEGDNPGLCEFEVYEDKLDLTPEYIKLYNDNDNETFMYKYIISDEKEIPLNVYSYPKQADNNISDKYKISVVDDDGSIIIENNILKISDNAKTGTYKIRVELIDNPEVFDEVEIVIPNKLQKIFIKYIGKLENVCLNIYYIFIYIRKGLIYS